MTEVKKSHRKRNITLGVVGTFLALSVIGSAMGGSKSAPAKAVAAPAVAKPVEAPKPAPKAPEAPKPVEAPKPKSLTPEDDVTLGRCAVDVSGHGSMAVVNVTNHSAKTSSYMITVKFSTDAQGSLGSGIANVADVDPGADDTDFALSKQTPTGELKCKVDSVWRTAS